MRIAIISAGCNDWAAASALVDELAPALNTVADVEASVWLVGESPQDRTTLFSEHAGSLHLLELQGRQPSTRAITTALGYLVCEREEQFDGYILLEGGHPRDARSVGALLENSFLHPGAVIFGKVNAKAIPRLHRIRRRWLGALAWALSGESLENSTLTFLPTRAAEVLSHSCHAGSHLEATVRLLSLPAVCTPAVRGAARPANSLAMLAGLSVFRERVFARAFATASFLAICSLLIAVALTTLNVERPGAISGIILALSWFATLLTGMIAIFSLLLGIGAQALNESRRWTPALDCALLLRSAKRVRRVPEAIAN